MKTKRRLHRFYIETTLSEGREITVTDSDRLNQWRNVFRMSAGDEVTLFDGSGFEFHAEFLEIHKEKAVLNVGEKTQAWTPTRKVTLYMSMIKKDLFELVVEKATELGVSEITPIITERSVVKNLNMERLKKIAIEASEQCGRGDVPQISTINNLPFTIDDAQGEKFVCDKDGISMNDCKLSIENCSLFIGPEGGWSEKELEMFKNLPAQAGKNVKFISLGPTTLRAETAAIVAVASFIK